VAVDYADHVRDWIERSRGLRSDGQPMPRRDIGDASRAPEIRFAFALADAAHRSESVADFIAQFESAWMRIQADVAASNRDSNATAALYLPADCDTNLRDLFALPSNQIQDRLLGFRDDADGMFIPGIACLTEAEFTATALWLEPVEDIIEHEGGMIAARLRLRNLSEIARDMASPAARRRFGRRAWLKESTVERYLSAARRKLRTLFSVPLARIAEMELEDIEPSSDAWVCPLGHPETELRWVEKTYRWICTFCSENQVERRIGHMWSTP
jgi:hypothetical protein